MRAIPENFIVILNDNKMSISQWRAMARYLAQIRTKPGYLRAKGNLESAVDKLPGGAVFCTRDFGRKNGG